MAYWHRNDPSSSFVYFHEQRDEAMRWSSSPLCGFALYSIDSSDVEGLEPHPQTPQIWRTAAPVPFARLTLEDRREDPTTLPGLLSMVEQRARELGTL
jgi:hypothetical protein